MPGQHRPGYQADYYQRRKQAEADLRRAGRDLALALQAAHDTIAAEHGCDGRCVYLHALRQWDRTTGDGQ
jgi:hypothetical protein